MPDIFKHKVTPGYTRGQAQHFWTLGFSGSIGTGSLLASNGVALANSRNTPATVDTSGAGDASSIRLLLPGTVRWEANGLLQEEGSTNAARYSGLIGYKEGANGWDAVGSAVGAPAVTMNSADVLAPDGTQTATKLVYPAIANASGEYTLMGQSVNAYRRSVWLRTASGTATVYINDGNSVNSSYVTCTLTTTWQRFSHVSAVINTWFWIGFDCRNDGSPGNTPGGPGVTIYAWGGQGETVSQPWTASYFPRDQNTIAASCDYTAVVSHMAVASTNNPDPFGGNTASKLTVEAGNNEHRFTPSPVTYLAGWNASVYAKFGAGVPYLTMWDVGAGYVTFDIRDGSTAATSGGATGSSEAIGNGWYRLSFNKSGAGIGLLLCNVGDTIAHAAPSTLWTAAGTEYIYAFGVQTNPGSVPMSFFQTLGSIPTAAAKDVMTIANPMSGTSPAFWGMGLTALPRGTWATMPTGGVPAVIFNIGAQVTPNALRMSIPSGGGGDSAIDIYDNATVVKTLTVAGLVSGSGAQSWAFRDDSAGNMTSSPGGGSFSGAGSGIIATQPATLTVGCYPSVGFSFQGWLRNIYLDNT